MIMPKETSSFLGNKHIEKFLLDDINKNRYRNYIFSGSPGVGKETLAFLFAKNFLSRNNTTIQSLDSSPEDKVFKSIVSGTNPRLIELNKEKILIEDIRHIIEKLSLKLNCKRCIIINNAETMNKSASNSLLKILEEHTDRTVFIIISSNYSSLLPTIRSRCVHLHLNNLTIDEMKQVLDKLNIDKNLSLIANGSIGLAQKLNEIGGINFYKDFLNCLENSVSEIDEFINHDFNLFKLLFFNLFIKYNLFRSHDINSLMQEEIDFFKKNSKFNDEFYSQSLLFIQNINKLSLDKNSVLLWLKKSLEE